MTTYKVSRQVTQQVLVEADSEKDALRKATCIASVGGRRPNGFKNLEEWQETGWSSWKAEEDHGWKWLMRKLRTRDKSKPPHD